MRGGLHKLLVLLLGCTLVVGQLRAGDIIVYEFKPGTPAAREALSHVRIKGLVSEFLDPADSGLGKSLGYLLWREILTAISDQAGAGVILARPPGEERLTDLLKRDYHQAALEIAGQQKARMLLWGAVNVTGDDIYLSSYLTLLPELIGADLALSLNIDGTDFSAANPRTRFNFAPIMTERDGLFRRAVVTRKTVEPRSEPNADAPRLGSVPKDTALQAIDMSGSWFRVELAGGDEGYVDQGDVTVPPQRITADESVNVRAGPGKDQVAQYRIAAGQSFDVHDMRYRQGHGTWYRIEHNGVPGWVAAWVVRPQYSMPAVLFMAGLYRYQSANYPEAIRSFELYLSSTETSGSNVNRAAAYQMLGAAQLANKRFQGQRDFDTENYLAPFDAAVELTPYDPAAYSLRVLGQLAGWSVPSAIEDLQTSLALDRFNPASYELLDTLTTMLSPDNERYRILENYELFQESDVSRIQEIHRDYASSRQIIDTPP